MRCSCRSVLSHGRALDRAHDGGMSAAAAKIGPHVMANFIVGRTAVDAQQCLRAHHHAGNAVPALRRLFIDEGLLELIWLAVSIRPSSVVILRSPTAAIGRMQEHAARPSR